nr:RNA-directed DNA polymerase, eukaryota, reverse transcriptase zinc-binding domain protein [Tanacetum cinerariifolium]
MEEDVSVMGDVMEVNNGTTKIMMDNEINGIEGKHFEEFLGKPQLVQEIKDYGSLFKRKVSDEVDMRMIADVSDNEIKKEMFEIDDSNAPRPDGFTAAFFKKAWSIIGTDVCKAVREFFMSRRMLGEINATLISLIPKVQTPNKVTDFRPIACCNVLYNASAKKGGPKRLAFKIDLQKAYDTVNWDTNSMKVIKRALDEFSACSGLLPNNSKSTVFFGSLCEEERD